MASRFASFLPPLRGSSTFVAGRQWVDTHGYLLASLRDLAGISPGKMPGQFDRYNMKREITLTANVEPLSAGGLDLGRASQKILAVLKRLEKSGEQPASVTTELRGQIPPMRQMLSGLGVGLLLAVVVIFLMLTANFQSVRLSLATVSTAPAVLAGVVVVLYATGQTINIQSFIGAIMAIGVAMANAILLVTFAEQRRHAGDTGWDPAVQGVIARVRPILMTSLAMTAGMLPMALGWGESGPQSAPLGRAVIGGLLAATIATLFILPAVFALLMGKTTSLIVVAARCRKVKPSPLSGKGWCARPLQPPATLL